MTHLFCNCPKTLTKTLKVKGIKSDFLLKITRDDMFIFIPSEGEENSVFESLMQKTRNVKN